MDTDGCIVCTDSKLAFCVTESNYVNSQHIIYCNSYSTFISRSYTNTVTQPDSTTTDSASTITTDSTATKTTGGPATVTATTTATPPPKTVLSTGALIGIGVGGVAAISIIAALLFWFCWSSRKGRYINPNIDNRSSLPLAPYPPISLDQTSKHDLKYQSGLGGGPAEMASPPLTGNVAFQAYSNYAASSGRQSPAPGPEAYLLPVDPYAQQHQNPQYQAYKPQPLTPTNYSDTAINDNNDNRISTTVSELGDTSSYRMEASDVSTVRLSASGAGGYVSPEDAWRTGRVRG